ncbi:hypothetical protein D7S94_27010 [Burkholderia contaminans]|nr:hypothetical protein [Burkholderia contaminans]
MYRTTEAPQSYFIVPSARQMQFLDISEIGSKCYSRGYSQNRSQTVKFKSRSLGRLKLKPQYQILLKQLSILSFWSTCNVHQILHYVNRQPAIER